MSHLLTAVHRRHARPAVIKCPRDTGPTAARAFENEVRALASCQHPNIPRLLDIDATPAGRPMLVMEALAGIDLARFLSQRGLSGRQFEALMADLLSAIDHCHRRGIVHRDIKPANIFVGPERCHLIDFGIAQLDNGAAVADEDDRRGTPGYSAPEQWTRSRVTPAADCFAIGRLIEAVLPREPTRRSHGWLELAEACTRVDPTTRPSVTELLRYAAARSSTPPLTVRPPPTRGKKTDRLLASLCLAAACCLLVSAFWRPGQQPPSRILSGPLQGEAAIAVEVAPASTVRLEPLAGTRLAMPDLGPPRPRSLTVRADADGRIALQVAGERDRWHLRISSSRR